MYVRKNTHIHAYSNKWFTVWTAGGLYTQIQCQVQVLNWFLVFTDDTKRCVLTCEVLVKQIPFLSIPSDSRVIQWGLLNGSTALGCCRDSDESDSSGKKHLNTLPTSGLLSEKWMTTWMTTNTDRPPPHGWKQFEKSWCGVLNISAHQGALLPGGYFRIAGNRRGPGSSRTLHNQRASQLSEHAIWGPAAMISLLTHHSTGGPRG